MLRHCCTFLLISCFLVFFADAASIEEVNRFDKIIEVGDVLKCSASFNLKNNDKVYKIDSWAIMKVLSSEENKKRYRTTQYFRLQGTQVPYIRYESIVVVTRESRGGREEIEPDSVQVFYPAAPEQEAALVKEVRNMAPFYYSFENITFTHFPDYTGKVKYPAVEEEVTLYCHLLGK
ncbi:hypothetical protein Q0A17_14175 [Citrobacter sp. S2-9]|uniref:DUF3857 domain-containing protein n=1 Tax=Citrobacter enshiensis TaxID=2971264 RepID=A0ABT8PX39_9ENTR|nr:hypothetical protein [Citrobacter enshiensis]MDN8600547.1 hypothetical protein [Citrobacter enshiensis]